MKKILESTMFSILFLPVALWYFVLSAINFVQEHIKIKNTINNNDAFTNALITLDFTASKYIPSLFIAILDVDPTLSESEIQVLAEREIISVIVNFIKSEDLLQYIVVDTEKVNNKVVFTIKPATMDIAARNLNLLLLSSILYGAIGTLLYFFL